MFTGRELRSGVKCIVVIIVTVSLRPSVFQYNSNVEAKLI